MILSLGKEVYHYKMKLGIGIVGSGAIARVHAQCIQSHSSAYISGVLSTSEDRARALATEVNTPYFVNSDAFYNQQGLHAVVICNESGRHGESLEKALDANMHVLCEKPLETSLDKIDKILNLVNSKNLKIGVVFQNRFNPEYKKLKKLVLEGFLGKILLVNTQINWYRDPSYYANREWRGSLDLDGGAALINQGIHTLDLLIDLIGAIDQVGGTIATRIHQIEGEDIAVAHFKFQNGTLGTLSAGTCLYPGYPESITVYGTKGQLHFEGGQIKSCSLSKWNPKSTSEGTSGNNSPSVNNIELHQAVFNDFMESIETDREPSVTPAVARKSVELIQAIYKASKSMQTIQI